MTPEPAPKRARKARKLWMEVVNPAPMPPRLYIISPPARSTFLGMNLASSPVSRLKKMLTSAGSERDILIRVELASGNAALMLLRSGTIAAFIKMVRVEMDRIAALVSFINNLPVG